MSFPLRTRTRGRPGRGDVAVFTSDPTSQQEWPLFTAWVSSFYGITI